MVNYFAVVLRIIVLSRDQNKQPSGCLENKSVDVVNALYLLGSSQDPSLYCLSA